MSATAAGRGQPPLAPPVDRFSRRPGSPGQPACDCRSSLSPTSRPVEDSILRVPDMPATSSPCRSSRRWLNLCYLTFVAVFEALHKLELMDELLLGSATASSSSSSSSSSSPARSPLDASSSAAVISYRCAVALRAVRVYLCYFATEQLLSTIGTYVHRSCDVRSVHLLYYHAVATFVFAVVPTTTNLYAKLALSLLLCRRFLVFELFGENAAPCVDLAVLTIASACAMAIRRVSVAVTNSRALAVRLLIGLACGLVLTVLANQPRGTDGRERDRDPRATIEFDEQKPPRSRRDDAKNETNNNNNNNNNHDDDYDEEADEGTDEAEADFCRGPGKASWFSSCLFIAMLCYQQISAKLSLMIALLWVSVLAYPPDVRLYVPDWPFGAVIAARLRDYVEMIARSAATSYTLFRADVYLLVYYAVAFAFALNRSIFADTFRRVARPYAQFTLLANMLLYNAVGALSVVATNNFWLIVLLFATLAAHEMLVCVFPYPYSVPSRDRLLANLVARLSCGATFALLAALSTATWLDGANYAFCAPAVVMFFLAAALFTLPYSRRHVRVAVPPLSAPVSSSPPLIAQTPLPTIVVATA